MPNPTAEERVKKIQNKIDNYIAIDPFATQNDVLRMVYKFCLSEISEAEATAREEEREACMDIAMGISEEWDADDGESPAWDVHEAIRARGEKK